MDSIRYGLALLVVTTFPGGIVVWLLLHGLLPLWRRVGPATTYLVCGVAMAATAGALYLVRRPLLAIDLGSNAWTLAAAVLVYGGAVFLETRCWKQLSFATLVGLPELRPESQPQHLLQEGIYARLRHPRYAALVLGLLAVALATGYLAAYGLVVAAAGGLYLVTILEERELLARFGPAYAQYRQRVPRFIPRLSWPSRPASIGPAR